MQIQNDPRTQFWIDPNTEISKWINQEEKIILIGDWNSEALEVKKKDVNTGTHQYNMRYTQVLI